jgi:hypothetical protein
MEGRVELRRQSVEQLEDVEAFTMAWLPGPFLQPGIVPAALERCRRALSPGGWLVFGLFLPPAEAFGQALNALQVVRDGGYPWTEEEVEQRLHGLGFVQIESYSSTPPMLHVVGRKARRLG